MSNEKKKMTNAEMVEKVDQLTAQVQQLQANMQEAQAYVAVLERANANYAQKEMASGKELAATQLRVELLERTLQQAQAAKKGEVSGDPAEGLTVVEGGKDDPSPDTSD